MIALVCLVPLFILRPEFSANDSLVSAELDLDLNLDLVSRDLFKVSAYIGCRLMTVSRVCVYTDCTQCMW